MVSTEKTKPTVDELLAKAKKPAQLSPPMHKFYEGKMQVIPKCTIRSVDDFAIWYTPGVAAPCREIQANPEKSFELTNRWNYVAVVTDGTRVLGLGDIGPEAAMPVMEGKALLFKYLGGVDAFPICLRTKDPEEIVRICKALEPTFGGINLEDIEKPKCFDVLERARSEMNIPVWHDDQQGTATVILAMADDAIVFACANPIPEIWPWEAEEAGARVVATGRSDFANQVNNSMGFPAIFRGVLDVKAKTITDDMCIAAATELADFAEDRGISEKDILPRMDEWEVFPREAVACALKSIEQGVARIKPSKQELYERASAIIKNARESTELLMKHGLIKQSPSELELLK